MSYQDFVMRSVRTQYAPRTLSEALRDAEYSSAIHYPPPSHKTGTDVLVSLLSVFVATGLFGYMFFSYINSIPK